MRILFGDKEAYLDKFKTSCRTRPIETQILGTAYYMKEHTKPLFHKHKILAFKNLYNYQICLETLKILKSKIPYYLFQLHPLSSRNNQNFLVANRNSSLFITNRIKLWNNCVKKARRGAKVSGDFLGGKNVAYIGQINVRWWGKYLGVQGNFRSARKEEVLILV